ncbi:penicillin-binding protein activator [Massilia sp. H-1]|nr:penicillin-binding protein activator [Massilia sp. H-1]
MVATSGTVSKPTIALNHPASGGDPVPPKMLVIGLSIEDEARQVAQWAAAEHPKSAALIVSGSNAWQRRIAAAFAARWQQLGNTSQLVEVPVSSGYLHESGISQVRTRIETEPIGPGLRRARRRPVAPGTRRPRQRHARVWHGLGQSRRRAGQRRGRARRRAPAGHAVAGAARQSGRHGLSAPGRPGHLARPGPPVRAGDRCIPGRAKLHLSQQAHSRWTA